MKNKIISMLLAISIILLIPMSALAETKTTDKEEVIYANLDGTGSVKGLYAVNIFGSGNVTDYGDYSTVKMLNTTDKINYNGKAVSFSTDTDKVYYQGDMKSKTIPWDIDITYFIDDKEYSAESVAGKSGKLKIKISITENTDCKEDYFDNFALQTSMQFDTTKCSNIVADGATMANVGVNKQLSYTILPSKGLDATITADVTDFEMDSISINAVMLSLNIDVDDAKLLDKVNKLIDASAELDGGAIKVNNGSNDLKDGAGKVNDGTSGLSTGAEKLETGATSLKTGSDAIESGLTELNSNSESLQTGSAQVNDALITIQSELSKISASSEDIEKLVSASGDIMSAIDKINNAAKTLSDNLSYASYLSLMDENGVDINKLKAGNDSAITSLENQIESLQSTLNTIKNIPGYEEQAKQLKEQIASLQNIVTLLKGNNGAISGTKTYIDTMSSSAALLSTYITQLDSQYKIFNSSISDLATKLSSMMINMTSLQNAINTLASQYSTLNTGISDYTNGVAKIVVGYSTLAGGINNLATGSEELNSGVSTLYSGTKSLYNGAVTLNNGTSKLANGTSTLKSETNGLDAKVEDEIDSLVSSLSGDSGNIKSFTSSDNGNITSLQFVIKTDEVKVEEKEEQEETQAETTSFWQKLLALFKKQ